MAKNGNIFIVLISNGTSYVPMACCKGNDIELGLTKYRYGSNQIDSSLPYNYITEYPYLFTTQERLKVRCKIKANIPPSLYQTMVQFNGNNYRMVALTHEPWNDEVVVTLQRNIS